MITIKEIAKLAGFSTTTVLNVIHGNTNKVSQENIDKINKIIKEKNYIQRMGLSALTNKHSHIIVVVIFIRKYYKNTILSDPFYAQIVGNLEQNIRKNGNYMMLYTSDKLDDISKMAVAWNVDGIIAISFTYENYQKIYSLTEKPIVTIDMHNPNKTNSVNIGIDDEDGGYQMTKFLIENNFTKILVLGNSDVGVDHNRFVGYQRAMNELNIPIEEESFIIADYETEEGREKLKDLLSYTNKGYALFFLSDLLASEAIQFLIKNNVSIPGDISIAGFDDNLYSKLIIPKITSVHQDIGFKAKVAIDTLLKLINNQELDECNIILPIYLKIRDSIKLKNDWI